MYTNKKLLDMETKLDIFQKREQEYFEKNGKKLLTGKVAVAYTITKNKGNIEAALEPYRKTVSELLKTCNSPEAQKKGVVKIMKEKEEEWQEGTKELLNIEVETEIKKVEFAKLEDLDLDSTDLCCLDFMID
ncbi:hypothetical protein KE540_01260 [Lachnospiraceae bacterium Marseille-Q4251]|nr:hypothetical protein [Lachnospiraceae bacterium Marseille-Q4251]